MPLSAWWYSEGAWQGPACRGFQRESSVSSVQTIHPSIPIQAADAMIYGMRMKF